MLTHPADCSTKFNYFYVKHCDWLVIGGVTGGGRAQKMVGVQALFFVAFLLHVTHTPCLSSCWPEKCRK